ncbi:hypothetical protein RJI07_08640 [Mycoplasmatota bacterium WC30]
MLILASAENITAATAITPTAPANAVITAAPITNFHAQCNIPLGSMYITGVM